MRLSRIGIALMVAFAAVGAGCSPKITTKMVVSTPRPVTVATDDVLVYGPFDEVPEGSEVLGTIKVKDTGFSGDNSYRDVVYMAAKIVSEKGGNALKVNKRTKPQALAKTTVNIDALILWVDTTKIAR